MGILDPWHGRDPSALQLVATHGVGLASAALVISALGADWRSFVLALAAYDWCGGVVANAAEPVRAWWRTRPGMHRGFIVVHLVELPIVYWLSGGGLIFYVLAIVLAMTLAVFSFGARRSD